MTKPMQHARPMILDELDDEPPQVGDNGFAPNVVDQDHHAAAVPSWFTNKTLDAAQRSFVNDPLPPPQFRSSFEPLSPEQQQEAHEAYRQRLEERFQLARTMAEAQARQEEEFEHFDEPPQPVHGTFPRRPRATVAAQGDGFNAPQRARGALGVSVPMALALLSAASCIGGLGGYLTANPGVPAQLMSIDVAGIWPFGPDTEVKPNVSVAKIQKKTEATARVDVADVAGAVNAPIPLDIAAYPREPGTLLSLKISGLPQDAYITKGKQVAEGEWLVRADDIRAAELIVTSAAQPELGLLVTAFEEKSGKAAAPSKSMRVALNLDAVPAPGLAPPPIAEDNAKAEDPRILPANAPPEQAGVVLPEAIPTPTDFLAGEASTYVEKGEMLLKVGDIVAARQFFMRAHELKSLDGAYGVARTYDPKVFLELNVQGLKPDAVKADEWYGKAAAQGHAKAQQALAAPD